MLPEVLLLLSFAGANAGSTGGGFKVIRVLLLVTQVMRETRRHMICAPVNSHTCMSAALG